MLNDANNYIGPVEIRSYISYESKLVWGLFLTKAIPKRSIILIEKSIASVPNPSVPVQALLVISQPSVPATGLLVSHQ